MILNLDSLLIDWLNRVLDILDVLAVILAAILVIPIVGVLALLFPPRFA